MADPSPTDDGPPPPAAEPQEELAFAAAIDELEAILTDLEADDVDIDRLAASVRRATELITLCRQRITGVELEISQILDR